MQTKRNVPRHLGLKITVGVILLLFVLGVAKFAQVVKTRLDWNTFQLQFAACVYDVGTEEGYLKAVSETETVRVCHENAYNVYRVLKTADVADSRRVKEAEEQIHLDFSDGGAAVLSYESNGTVHVDFTNPAGKRWQFHLGKCDFSKIRKLLSAKGAAVENSLWTD